MQIGGHHIAFCIIVIAIIIGLLFSNNNSVYKKLIATTNRVDQLEIELTSLQTRLGKIDTPLITKNNHISNNEVVQEGGNGIDVENIVRENVDTEIDGEIDADGELSLENLEKMFTSLDPPNEEALMSVLQKQIAEISDDDDNHSSDESDNDMEMDVNGQNEVMSSSRMFEVETVRQSSEDEVSEPSPSPKRVLNLADEESDVEDHPVPTKTILTSSPPQKKLTKKECMAMTVTELKTIAKLRGVSGIGKKNDIVSRLVKT
jgi:hypothetical protein